MADAELRLWDPAEHLETHESCVTFLDVALEADDPVLVVDVLDAIARSKRNERVVGRDSRALRKLVPAPLGRR